MDCVPALWHVVTHMGLTMAYFFGTDLKVSVKNQDLMHEMFCCGYDGAWERMLKYVYNLYLPWPWIVCELATCLVVIKDRAGLFFFFFWGEHTEWQEVWQNHKPGLPHKATCTNKGKVYDGKMMIKIKCI